MRISGSALAAQSPSSDPREAGEGHRRQHEGDEERRTKATRYLCRQYQTRRRATMSSSSSSRPGAVEARPRDQLVGEDVDAPAEGDDEEEGAEQRPAQRPVLPGVEGGEGGGARQDRDERRGPGQLAPFARRARCAPRRGRGPPRIGLLRGHRLRVPASAAVQVAGPGGRARCPAGPYRRPAWSPVRAPRRAAALAAVLAAALSARRPAPRRAWARAPTAARLRVRDAQRAAGPHGRRRAASGCGCASPRGAARRRRPAARSRCRAGRGRRPSRPPRRSPRPCNPRCAATASSCSTSAGPGARAR